MPKLIMLVGLPAMGKSHLRNSLNSNANEPFVNISSDDQIDLHAKNVGKTYDEVFSSYVGVASQIIDAQARAAIKAGHNVIWDQTNLTAKKRKQILNMFDGYYKWACAVELGHDSYAAEWHRRLGNRDGKTIPDMIIRNMINSYVPPTADEGFDAIIHYDMWGKVLKADSHHVYAA
jgi:predicted kinase